jgi:drug/metabolite transporter (DMT)-like permease
LKVLDFLTLFVGLGHIVFIMLIIFWCMKRLPIVSVSIFLNLGPLLTVLLAVYVLKEKASIFSFVQAGFSFIGVVCIVLGH